MDGSLVRDWSIGHVTIARIPNKLGNHGGFRHRHLHIAALFQSEFSGRRVEGLDHDEVQP
jgi:hypothetical protein